jgi:predicted nucleotidyltransferase component of viral defense system
MCAVRLQTAVVEFAANNRGGDAMSVIEQMLERYSGMPTGDRQHALREVMQEIALAGLNRAGFFGKAAFYGGTCLRIFHGLPRFSEDLDFSLLQPDPQFSLAPYFNTLVAEFAAFGLEVDIQQRQKSVASAVVSAFLKNNTRIHDLQIAGKPTLKIKFEVDTLPPLKFSTEEKLLLHPYSFYVKCFALPDLFAGKMHALLYRQWQSRVKGRDWFDFEWYVRKGVTLNLNHFCERALQSGDLETNKLTSAEFLQLLLTRINSVDIAAARQDVVRFTQNPEQLDIWSQHYFAELAGKVRFE